MILLFILVTNRYIYIYIYNVAIILLSAQLIDNKLFVESKLPGQTMPGETRTRILQIYTHSEPLWSPWFIRIHRGLVIL